MKMTPTRFLYATDGSAIALLGAELLKALPLDSQDEIRVLAVVSKDQPNQTPEEAAADLDAADIALQGSPAQVKRRVRQGHASEEILHEAEAAPTDIIVVGAQGKSAVARFFLGSVSEWVARNARCSVLVARALNGPLDTLIVGVDGSESAQAVVRFLTSHPLPRECEVRLVAVIVPEAVVKSAHHVLLPGLADEIATITANQRDTAAAYLAESAADLSAGGYRVTTEIRTGATALQILEAAEEANADMIVVGARGVTDVDRFFLGSVSERVLRHAPCSVLIVK